MKNNNENKKYMLLLFTILLIIGVLFLAAYLKKVSNYQKTVAEITFTNPAVAELPDGIYTGECNAYLVSAKVSVTVKDGEITDIKLFEHKNERGTPAEAIIKEIIRLQKTDVDAVTGATNSSKVIKKAVENALTAN